MDAITFFGIQFRLPDFFGEKDLHKLDSVQDFNFLLRRIRKIPAQLEQVSPDPSPAYNRINLGGHQQVSIKFNFTIYG